MKAITFLLAALATGLLSATLCAQSTTSKNANNDPVNYYAEFADLMHGEISARPAPVTTPPANRFSAFVHYREVMKGTPQGFLNYYEKTTPASVPLVKAATTSWTVGQGCPHDAMTDDCTAFKALSVKDCSGR